MKHGGWGTWLFLGCFGFLPACSKPTPAAAPASVASRAPESKPDVLQASTTVVTEGEAMALEDLLERGQVELEREEYAAATRTFDLALSHATLPENRLRALYGLGTAYDLDARPQEALRTYARYVAEAPKKSARRREVSVRQVRLLVYLERYDEAARRSLQVDLEGLTDLQQLALLAARAHHELEAGHLDAASRTISKGRAIVDAHSLDRITVPPLDVASLFMALGELRARRAEAIKFDPLPGDFAVALEERCQHILDAQGAFSEAMRSKDAHWSAMAGVKVGQLYKSLHTDLMTIEPPKTAVSDEKKQLFEGAMRLRYSILLRKSLAMMEATVSLVDRTQERSRWTEKARIALEEIRAAQLAEEKAIDALPYTRIQLQQVLDDMAAKAQSSSTGNSGT